MLRSVVCLFAVALPLSAQNKVIRVWPGTAPGSEDWTHKEAISNMQSNDRRVRNIVDPTLTAFFPNRPDANGTAIVVCPGGGFRFLSWDSEGTRVAQWLADRGVAAFVLKYRLNYTGATEEEFRKSVAQLSGMRSATSGARPPASPEAMKIRALAAADGQQAIKVVRQHASEWGIEPDRIGIMGFSAGGSVTMAVVMEHDAGSRPNFAAPIYGGSVGEAKIPADAPPLFILAANDDPMGSIASAKLYSDWKAAGLPVELHIYAKGGHGFGMNKKGLPVDHWIERFGDWLQMQGLLKPASLQPRPSGQ